MERSLLWSALALGCAGWLCGLVLTSTRRQALTAGPEVAGGVTLERPFLVTAILLPLLAYLITLPAQPPFGSGQGSGRGFVLGALGALLSAWVVLRAGNLLSDPRNHLLRTAAVAAPYAASIVTVVIPLMWMRDTIIDTLLGAAIGWLVISFVLYIGVAARRGGEVVQLVLASGAGFAVTLCVLVALGVYRGSFTPPGHIYLWSTTAVAFAAGIPLALILSVLPAQLLASNTAVARFVEGRTQRADAQRGRGVSGHGWQLIFSLILLLALGHLLAGKVIEEPRVFYVIGIGLFIALVAWWVVRNGVHGHAGSGAALSPLVVLSGFMAAFQMLQGFGAGLMLLTAWPAVALAVCAAFEDESERMGEWGSVRIEESEVTAGAPDLPLPHSPAQSVAISLLRLLLFGAVLLLYRFFTTRFDDALQGVGLTDHYALFGFLVGALLPGFLGSLQSPGAAASEKPGFQIARLVLTGALVLAAPAMILMLWGPKSALALLPGLALAATGFLMPGDERPSATPPRHHLTTSLLALSVALALAQWTRHVLPLADMTRAEKIGVLTWIVSVLLVLLLVADYGGRLLEWMQRQRQNKAAPLAKEGAPR